jgi:predicted adenine nucleotide alpha hydrolase (AANH) superfamily ATPase
MRLLLHTCCAPCSIGCIAALGEEGIRPDLYWYNPNIHPLMEYRSRRESLTALALAEGLKLTLTDDYGLRPFIGGLSGSGEAAAGSPSGSDPFGPERRCPRCYRMRLERAAAAAAGYDAFSTTLLISPYQNHELIRKLGEEIGKRSGIEFFYRDFRDHFHAGRQEARSRSCYMQKYCGCIFSEEERYSRPVNKRERPVPC